MIIGVGNLSLERAEEAINDGVIDLAAFGRPFIANPDLVQRWTTGLPLTTYDATRHLSVLK